ncbi:MAG TPA: NAD(P)/FAD-dependent oxidoreductase [Chitinophagaceae bacterium]|nr:NAD(P)/FAD-dependent oxidoreductase [Chitinophagaceae bacterium]
MQENKYDIVIIGAGLGGLVSGALLSKEGFKVCVLEKNKQIGGCLQSFGFDGKLFESAIHYVGSLAENQTLFKIFNYLGLMSKLSLKRLDTNCYDQIIIDDIHYNMAQGHDAFVESIASNFPNHLSEIRNYMGDIVSTCKQFPLYNLRNGDAQEKNAVTGFGLKSRLSEFISNPLLQQVLTGNNLLHGGHFEYSPYYMHALIQNSYIESSWKCKEGSAQIAKLLQEVIKENGGEVIRNIEVVKMYEKDGLLVYAEDKRGERYYAKHFISNLHPQVSFQLLESNLIRPITVRRLNSLENTMSSFILNLSLHDKQIPYRNHNIYYHKQKDVWKDVHENIQTSPNSFGIFFTEDEANPGYARSISILTYLNYNALNKWSDSFHTTAVREKRNDDYQDFKQNYSETIIDSLQMIIPNLKQAIKAKDASTPLTFRDYLNTPNGSMYGIQKDIRNLTATTIATRTKIPNLYLTGQNINLHGVLGVSITALLTASEIIGLDYLVNKINIEPKNM